VILESRREFALSWQNQEHVNALEQGQSKTHQMASAITRYRQQSGLAQVQPAANFPRSNADEEATLDLPGSTLK
jgi:hypothetical protein